MATVITVAQQKGGAGKTTLAANSAAALAANRRVALLDVDPQRSLTRWNELRKTRNGKCRQNHVFRCLRLAPSGRVGQAAARA